MPLGHGVVICPGPSGQTGFSGRYQWAGVLPRRAPSIAPLAALPSAVALLTPPPALLLPGLAGAGRARGVLRGAIELQAVRRIQPVLRALGFQLRVGIGGALLVVDPHRLVQGRPGVLFRPGLLRVAAAGELLARVSALVVEAHGALGAGR